MVQNGCGHRLRVTGAGGTPRLKVTSCEGFFSVCEENGRCRSRGRARSFCHILFYSGESCALCQFPTRIFQVTGSFGVGGFLQPTTNSVVIPGREQREPGIQARKGAILGSGFRIAAPE